MRHFTIFAARGHFLLLVCLAGCGPATISSDTVSREDIRDGIDRTVIAMALQDGHGVPWTEPRDLWFDDGFPDLTAGGPISGLTPLVLADGGVISFPIHEGFDRRKFRGMFTIAGGESLTRSEIMGGDFYAPDFQYRSLDGATTPEEVERRGQSRIARTRALKSIALALYQYHEKHGHFPPAIIYGEDGRPWHSWRVLILPFLGEAEKKLHARYDFGVPWDHARNLPLLDAAPPVFRGGPAAAGSLPQTTPIVLVTGPGTAFPLSVKSDEE